jgi:hypothetical protein
VSAVALFHPVVVVSPGVDVSAVLRVAAVVPVLAMRWLSFVHEGGLVRQWNRTGCADSEHLDSGMSRRKPAADWRIISGKSVGPA